MMLLRFAIFSFARLEELKNWKIVKKTEREALRIAEEEQFCRKRETQMWLGFDSRCGATRVLISRIKQLK